MAFIIDEGIKKEVRCINCGKLIGYDDDDVYFTENDDGFTGLGIDCPHCQHVILTKIVKEGKYPDAFYQYNNGAKMSDAQIQEWIDTIIDNIKNGDAEEGEYYFIGSGDTMVFGFLNEDKSIDIYVAKNYQEATIYHAS